MLLCTYVSDISVLAVLKAELLQLNHTQFSSLGIFVSKKIGNRKTKTTFIISVLKVVYWVVLVFSMFWADKNLEHKIIAKTCV